MSQRHRALYQEEKRKTSATNKNRNEKRGNNGLPPCRRILHQTRAQSRPFASVHIHPRAIILLQTYRALDHQKEQRRNSPWKENIHDRDQPSLIIGCAPAPDVRPVIVARKGRIFPIEDGGSLDGNDVCGISEHNDGCGGRGGNWNGPWWAVSMSGLSDSSDPVHS